MVIYGIGVVYIYIIYLYSNDNISRLMCSYIIDIISPNHKYLLFEINYSTIIQKIHKLSMYITERVND